jgi:hypothetical protein
LHILSLAGNHVKAQRQPLRGASDHGRSTRVSVDLEARRRLKSH